MVKAPNSWSRRGVLPLMACLALATSSTGWSATSPRVPTVTYLRSYRAPFLVPTRIAVDTRGNVYVTDTGQRRVIARAPSGRVVSRTGGLGRPLSIAAANDGTLYVGDGDSGAVTAFDSDWQPILQMGRGTGEFLLPSDLAVDDETGELYVADSAAHQVRVYDTAGVFQRSFGGRGSGDGEFDFPVGVFVDVAARQVLVVDQLNHRIQVFELTGKFVSSFGTQGSAPGQFHMPQGIWVDAHGRVYVADSLEGRIQVLDRDGNFVGSIADFGEAAGQLRMPMDLVFDPSNRLFVTAANNSRLEMFGVDVFDDPESIAPAVVRVTPHPIERSSPVAVIVCYLEVAAHPLDQLAAKSIRANGVSPTTAPIVITDHDGNGTAEARVEFDRAALLATLPEDGVGTIVIDGAIADERFEASAIVHIRTCGPGATCSLGDADPQCNEAPCVAPDGCTVQPKADGTGCEDGDACTVGDQCRDGVCRGASLSCNDDNVCTDDGCDPASGCMHESNTASCDDGSACTLDDACAGGVCGGTPAVCDDGNACTNDTCEPVSGCVYRNTDLPCDDQNACTVGETCTAGYCNGQSLSCDDRNACTDDSCDRISGCLYANNAAACDDGDPGTVLDLCDGAGRCAGHDAIGGYALLAWRPLSPGHRSVALSTGAVVRGDICGERVVVGSSGAIEGDTIGSASRGWAIMFAPGSRLSGNVVTGGGGIIGGDRVLVNGGVDRSGATIELGECAAARYRANSRRGELAGLSPSRGLALGSISLGPAASQRIPSAGRLGIGQSVIELDDVQLGRSSTLTLAGTRGANAVIVLVRGRMILGREARIQADGLQPAQVVFVVDGSVVAQPNARLVGTVFAARKVRVGTGGTVTGALFGGDVSLGARVTVELDPFFGW
jgi:DNA-binding beta-propeller fold protein YncE